MDKITRKQDLLSKEKKRAIIESIITFFKEERDEEIGIIAAENILDFILQNAGNEIYNKGVEDSRNLLKSRFENLELELDILLSK